MSHNPRLCSGVTIHERSNEDDDCGNDATTTATTTRTNSSSIIIIFIRSSDPRGRERSNRGERVLALTEVLYSLTANTTHTGMAGELGLVFERGALRVGELRHGRRARLGF